MNSAIEKQTLHLTLKRQWFEMIRDRVKLEEYREIKPYWITRLKCRSYDFVRFVNGYGAHRPWMVFGFDGIKTGKGRSEWGAPDKEVFIIKLGKLIQLSE